jgi:hypothetical protein
MGDGDARTEPEMGDGEAQTGPEMGDGGARSKLGRVMAVRGLTAAQADDIRQALVLAERRSGLRFGMFLGAPVGGRRHFAERLHAALGEEADEAVVIVVDLTGRALEIVTGETARHRLSDGACRLTAMSMATAFSVGDLVGGLLFGIAALGEQATARR